jgi:predicted Zn-dependent protease with MMP-like domain
MPAIPGHPALRTRRERFDDLALGIVTEIDERWQDRLGLVEYAVEDTPLVPDDWTAETVPLSSLVRGSGTTPTRLVLFRRPIEHRCETRAELEDLLLTVVVEQVAELLGIDAEQVDPRYERDD